MSTRLARAKEEDERCLTDKEMAAVYARYGPYALRRCRRILRNEAAAEDALQETFLRLWRRSDQLSQAESKLAWICRVAENCALDHLTQPSTRLTLPLNYREVATRLQLQPAVDAEDRDAAVRFLGMLDEKLLQVALLHYVSEMRQEEIARAVGCCRQTVVNRLAIVKQRMATFRSAVAYRENVASLRSLKMTPRWLAP